MRTLEEIQEELEALVRKEQSGQPPTKADRELLCQLKEELRAAAVQMQSDFSEWIRDNYPSGPAWTGD